MVPGEFAEAERSVGDRDSAKTIKLPHKSISVSGPAAIPFLLVDNEDASTADVAVAAPPLPPTTDAAADDGVGVVAVVGGGDVEVPIAPFTPPELPFD